MAIYFFFDYASKILDIFHSVFSSLSLIFHWKVALSDNSITIKINMTASHQNMK